MASSSSTHERQNLPAPYGPTAAPPPTPSMHQPSQLSTSDAADTLSRLLHRLPPTLSLPSRRLSSPTPSPPVISFSKQNPHLLNHLLSSSSQLGFFQLTHHSIPSQLPRSAELQSLSLFDLPPDQKLRCFSENWPLCLEHDDDQDGDGTTESFCFDESSADLASLPSLRDFTRALQKLALEVVESLSCAVGFENPFRDEPNRFCSLMWITEAVAGNKQDSPDRFYPYVVALQYQIRCQSYSLLADSGWVPVSPQIDSVLVTVGDIAQVWSNGKLKKVRGRPVPNSPSSSSDDNSRCVTMSLLLTLPADSTVSPLSMKIAPGTTDKDNQNEEDGNDVSVGERGEENKFVSFTFEDYAWRVYHERLLFKDPLDRYRI